MLLFNQSSGSGSSLIINLLLQELNEAKIGIENLKFTYQTLSKYQYKKFLNQTFSIDLINKAHLKPSLIDLIERVENLIQFNHTYIRYFHTLFSYAILQI